MKAQIYGALTALFTFLVLWFVLPVKAQPAEVPAPPPGSSKVWEFGWIKDPSIKLYVVETTGVCVYVATQPFGGSGLAITSQPKSALPKGVGCQ